MTVHRKSPGASRNNGLTVAKVGLMFIMIGLLLCACTPVQSPSRLAQVCVHNDEGLSQFRSDLQALAKERQMEFGEDSDDLKRHFDSIGYAGPDRKKGDPEIHMVIEHKDGLGLSALNVGLHTYQLALVFSGGKDEAEVREFSEDLIARLRQKWKVEEVPKGSRVLPDDHCR